ncbi:hypothetical protein [Mycobacterium simiae]|uniref:hypothetical protein n=1 Tax=Mycobacterium simiae TaxID=1784 RepID=UPI002627E073|nr:hypothetical protein [Mycobacterium simiae]
MKRRSEAVWLQDTAEAFEEIGQTDLAIDWATQATASTMATNPAAPPTTGVNSSTNTDRMSPYMLACWVSVVSHRQRPRHVCTPLPAAAGQNIKSRS